ncbi:hypothetical protein DFH09DRAFT_1354511 [Mycena vulgaris]|nr:hypothetical protein DFH09DRAFT_1354511 [Mycena vulgaris]
MYTPYRSVAFICALHGSMPLFALLSQSPRPVTLPQSKSSLPFFVGFMSPHHTVVLSTSSPLRPLLALPAPLPSVTLVDSRHFSSLLLIPVFPPRVCALSLALRPPARVSLDLTPRASLPLPQSRFRILASAPLPFSARIRSRPHLSRSSSPSPSRASLPPPRRTLLPPPLPCPVPPPSPLPASPSLLPSLSRYPAGAAAALLLVPSSLRARRCTTGWKNGAEGRRVERRPARWGRARGLDAGCVVDGGVGVESGRGRGVRAARMWMQVDGGAASGGVQNGRARLPRGGGRGVQNGCERGRARMWMQMLRADQALVAEADAARRGDGVPQVAALEVWMPGRAHELGVVRRASWSGGVHRLRLWVEADVQCARAVRMTDRVRRVYECGAVEARRARRARRVDAGVYRRRYGSERYSLLVHSLPSEQPAPSYSRPLLLVLRLSLTLARRASGYSLLE